MSYYNPKLPKVSSGVLASIAKSMNEPDWLKDVFTKLQLHDPVIAQFIAEYTEKWGEKAGMCGVLVYRILDSQLEANELHELLGG